MALVFPPSPNVDDVYLGWRWDGTKWTYVSGVAGVAGVSSYNTRTGAVTSVLADVTTVTGTGATAQSRLGLATVAATGAYADLSGSPPTDATRAPLDSPPLTGNPTAPTPTAGDNDTSIATTAFVQTAVAPVANNVGRNLLHNSMFNVQQRGAGPWTTSGAYTADRWLITSATDAVSVTAVTLLDADRTAIGDEAAQSALRDVFTGSAAAGAFNGIQQKIEGVRRLSGKTVTVSFYAKAVSGTPKIGVNMYLDSGTGGTGKGWLASGQSVTIGTTWARYSMTLTLPGTSGLTVTGGNDNWTLGLFFSSGANTNAIAGNIGVQSDTISLWGVQCEVGAVATPLEKPDPQVDLANCQRFYQAANIAQHGYSTSGGGLSQSILFPVAMRVLPTIVFSGTTANNCTGLSAWAVTQLMFVPLVTVTTTGTANYNSAFTASADL